MNCLTTFIQKGDTFDIHEKCFPPPVEWIWAIASHNSHWYFSFPCQNMICIKQLLCLCPIRFNTFHTCFSCWRLSFLLLHLRPSVFFLVACLQSFMRVTSIFANLPGTVGYIHFLWAIAKPYCSFSRPLGWLEKYTSIRDKRGSLEIPGGFAFFKLFTGVLGGNLGSIKQMLPMAMLTGKKKKTFLFSV